MKLTLGKVLVQDIVFADETKLVNGVLHFEPSQYEKLVLEDEKIATVSFDIAKPGESVRITPVKDVIEPRFRVGRRNGFPGVTTKYEQAGDGAVNILKGATVVTIGDLVGFQEGVIDMWGEGARWTPFSKTQNIVVDITPIDGLDPHAHEVVVRMAGLRAATFVGLAAKDAEIDETKVYEMATMAEETAKYPDLPKVA